MQEYSTFRRQGIGGKIGLDFVNDGESDYTAELPKENSVGQQSKNHLLLATKLPYHPSGWTWFLVSASSRGWKPACSIPSRSLLPPRDSARQ
jgi:hypothetical protein